MGYLLPFAAGFLVGNSGSRRWSAPLPKKWLPPTVSHRVRYDSPPPWKDDGSSCTGKFTAGAEFLSAHIKANFSVRRIGGYSCRRNTANLAQTSVHGVGRAIDIYPRSHEDGVKLANWLVSNAPALGVQYVIWSRSRWSGKSGKSGDYQGPDDHTDHVHAEINEDAAAMKLPFYKAGK